jgi:enamine deaminase RidA (YjgF/YER057c/UK114 family)
MKRTVATVVALLLLPALNVTAAPAAEIVRKPLGGGSTFPIARAVQVPAGFELIFHSGLTPTPADPKAKEGTPEYWGDTKTQATAVFTRLAESLKEMGLGFGDVVKMTVFLVGEPTTGKMDFKGFMDAYTQHFGTKEQPNLPARSAVQVASLAQPGMLVEVEVILAKKSH